MVGRLRTGDPVADWERLKEEILANAEDGRRAARDAEARVFARRCQREHLQQEIVAMGFADGRLLGAGIRKKLSEIDPAWDMPAGMQDEDAA